MIGGHRTRGSAMHTEEGANTLCSGSTQLFKKTLSPRTNNYRVSFVGDEQDGKQERPASHLADRQSQRDRRCPGRGRALSPLATYWFDLDGAGRYVPEPDTDAPAVRIAFPDDPANPGLLPTVAEAVAMRLAPAVNTLLATLAVLATEEPLETAVPDVRQSNAYRRRSGRPLVPYQRIPHQAPALDDLLPAQP